MNEKFNRRDRVPVSRGELASAITDRYDNHMDDEHVLLKYQIDLDVIDAAANSLGKKLPDVSRSIQYSRDDLLAAGRYRRNRTKTTTGGSDDNQVKIIPIGKSREQVRVEIAFFKRMFSEYISTHLQKPMNTINAVNIGVKNGRLTAALQGLVHNISGVVFDKRLVDKFNNIHIDMASIDNFDKLPSVQNADVLIFTRNLYNMDVDTVLETLNRLENNPLVIVNEPNDYTKWEQPKLDKTSESFEIAEYNKVMKSVNSVERKLKASDKFIILDTQFDVDIGGNVYLLKKFKITPSAGMLVIKNTIEEIIEKYTTESDHRIKIADLGCGNGRYAFYLSDYYSEVIAIDVRDIKIRNANAMAKKLKYTNVTFNVHEIEDMSSLKKIHQCGILLFSGSFHFTRFNETFEQIILLNSKPIVIIKEPNSTTTSWHHPSLDKTSDRFDQKLFDKKINALELADRFICKQNMLKLLSRVVYAEHTIFILASS